MSRRSCLVLRDYTSRSKLQRLASGILLRLYQNFMVRTRRDSGVNGLMSKRKRRGKIWEQGEITVPTPTGDVTAPYRVIGGWGKTHALVEVLGQNGWIGSSKLDNTAAVVAGWQLLASYGILRAELVDGKLVKNKFYSAMESAYGNDYDRRS